MINNIIYFQAFVIGSCIGSFLNVIIYRFPNDLSIITPRSFCPKCKTQLTWRENIPFISWLIQRRKCITCKTTISSRYPLIELFTGVLFAIVVNSSPSIYASSSNLFFNIFFSWIFLSLLICIAFIDIDCLWIPQGLLNFGYISGFLGLIFLSIFGNEFIDFVLLLKGLGSSLISFLIFEIFRRVAKYIFKKDAVGKGDSKLVAMLALWLGPIGTLFAVGFSYIFAAIFCFVGLSTNYLSLRQVIPFAPFISLGGLTVWFLGNEFIMLKILRI
jgi:leader peptidase (prepilin peptidase)/N-methyltransferase